MAKFKEVTRFTVTKSRDIVASEVIEDGEVKGINFGSYIRTQKYTGHAKGGLFVPVNMMHEFEELVKTAHSILVE